jgi:hypothetical protein
MEMATVGCPFLETRRGVVAERPKLCELMDIYLCMVGLWVHEKNTHVEKKTLLPLGPCSHDPPWKVWPIVGLCDTCASCGEPGVRLPGRKLPQMVELPAQAARAAHPTRTTGRLTSESLRNRKATPSSSNADAVLRPLTSLAGVQKEEPDSKMIIAAVECSLHTATR